MTLSRCVTYGQLLLFVVLLIGIAHLLRGVVARVLPVAGPVTRPGRTHLASLSVLCI
ncbi:hypothetical protein ACIBBE_09305 [Streptomyces sp. NPDC051644]|uniref:hypothetical protein n=1 Tax=Streptomyces sp. NPDC051644 TaxID=3365666 RepID=UPI0037919349